MFVPEVAAPPPPPPPPFVPAEPPVAVAPPLPAAPPPVPPPGVPLLPTDGSSTPHPPRAGPRHRPYRPRPEGWGKRYGRRARRRRSDPPRLHHPCHRHRRRP